MSPWRLTHKARLFDGTFTNSKVVVHLQQPSEIIESSVATSSEARMEAY